MGLVCVAWLVQYTYERLVLCLICMNVFSRLRSAHLVVLLRQPGKGRARLAVLAGGFLAILLVIAAVIGLSLHSLAQTRAHLDYLANRLQQKMVAVATMREYLFLRLVTSRDMLLMTDAFEIDEAAQRLYTYPARIEAAYLRFRALADHPEEIALAEKFIEEAKLGLPLINEAAARLISGQRSADIQPLLQKAFETQKLGLDTLETLYFYLQDQGARLSREAIERHDTTRLLMITLTIAAMLVVIVIAVIMAVLLEQNAADLEREHEKYKSLFEASQDAVLILTDGVITEWNLRALEWFDYRGLGELTGLRLDDLSPPTETVGHDAGERMLRYVTAQGGGNFEWVFRGRDEKPFYGEVSLTPLPGVDDPQLQLVIRDITARILAMQQMSHAATHDPLTGLANRREFERRLQLALDAATHSDQTHVLCYLDLDKFKAVNDGAGHAAGDELLKQIAGLLKARIRIADLLARLGGDEFGLLLENCTHERATVIALGLIQGVNELRFSADGHYYRVGISVGLVNIKPHAVATDILAAADQACYAAKHSRTHLHIASTG
jgi:diguanylate cyclase (GGDEF)-like protein/PAS domain S-box-containing protein